ncbi:hypothetical protein, partial [Finegoldia magna]|uniref:hypothetical protein n=1 Tax=Finegoldia magna TaxID=1260 RepID=UPI0023A97825
RTWRLLLRLRQQRDALDLPELLATPLAESTAAHRTSARAELWWLPQSELTARARLELSDYRHDQNPAASG